MERLCRTNIKKKSPSARQSIYLRYHVGVFPNARAFAIRKLSLHSKTERPPQPVIRTLKSTAKQLPTQERSFTRVKMSQLVPRSQPVQPQRGGLENLLPLPSERRERSERQPRVPPTRQAKPRHTRDPLPRHLPPMSSSLPEQRGAQQGPRNSKPAGNAVMRSSLPRTFRSFPMPSSVHHSAFPYAPDTCLCASEEAQSESLRMQQLDLLF